MQRQWDALLDRLSHAIVRPGTGANRSRLRARLPQIAAGAAVLICLVGAWGVVRNPFGTSSVKGGRLVAAGNVDDASAAQRPTQLSAWQRPTAVPKNTQLWGLSAPTARRWFALASVTCGPERCPAVLRTRDAGRTWQVTHVFAHTDTSAASGPAQPDVQPDGALSGITFVDSSVGYVYGGDLWMTRDGGATFIRLPHPNATVLDVIAHGRTVTILTAEGCVQGTCSGRLALIRPIAGSVAALPAPVAGVTPDATISSAHLVQTPDETLLVAQGVPGSVGNAPGAWRLSGTALTELPVRSACHGNAVLAVASADAATVGLCDATPATSSTSYSTLGQSGSAATWALRGAGNLVLPTVGRVDLAALSDGHTLIASTGGPRLAADGTTRSDTRAALAVSSDDGATWHAPRRPPSGVDGGFDSLVAVNARTIVAIPRVGPTWWRSTDAGQTWEKATVTGASG